MYLQHMILNIGRSCTKKSVWRDRNHSVPGRPYYVIRPEGEGVCALVMYTARLGLKARAQARLVRAQAWPKPEPGPMLGPGSAQGSAWLRPGLSTSQRLVLSLNQISFKKIGPYSANGGEVEGVEANTNTNKYERERQPFVFAFVHVRVWNEVNKDDVWASTVVAVCGGMKWVRTR